VSSHDLLQQALVSPLVVASKHPLEGMDLSVADGQVEALPDRLRDAREAGPVGHMLVHGPAFQGVAELLQPQVVRRQKPLPAPSTVVPGRPVAGHVTPDPGAGEAQVEGQSGQTPVLTPVQLSASAGRAGRAADFDFTVDAAILLPFLGTFASRALLQT